MPKDFAGTLLIHGLLFKIWEPLVAILTPLFAVLSALVLSKLAAELFDRRVAFLTFILWLTYPPAWINGSYAFTSDTLALFFILSTFLWFVRYMRTPSRLGLVCMAASLGAAITVRYPSAIIAIPLAVALVLGRRISLKDAALAALTIVPFVVSILLFNRYVYGDPLLTGFHLGADLFAETVNFQGESFFKFRFDAVLTHLLHYAVLIPTLLSAQLVGLGLMARSALKRSRDQLVVCGLFGAGLILVLYYIPQDAWGSTAPAINASSLRYILPTTALGTVFLAWGVIRLWHRISTAKARWLVPGAITVLILANVLTVVIGPEGLLGVRKYRQRLTLVRDAVTRLTEPDSLVLTRFTDKTIFPRRQTLTATFLVQNERPVYKPPGGTWLPTPSAERFAEVAHTSWNLDIPLYVVDIRQWRIRAYNRELTSGGLRLWRVRTGPDGTRGHVRLFVLRRAGPFDRSAGGDATAQP